MKSRRIIQDIIMALLAIALTTSCSKNMRDSLSEMSSLRASAMEKYHPEDIGINLMNNVTLNVSLTNSLFNDLPQTAKNEKAKEIAKWVNTTYKHSKSLKSITIIFVKHKSYLLVFNTNNNDAYQFSSFELNAKPATLNNANLVELEIIRFHQNLDSENFHELYDKSGNEFQKAMPKDEFLKMVNVIHSKLGVVQTSKSISTNSVDNATGTIVEIIKETTFSLGKGSERFVYRIQNQQAFLIGYWVKTDTTLS